MGSTVRCASLSMRRGATLEEIDGRGKERRPDDAGEVGQSLLPVERVEVLDVCVERLARVGVEQPVEGAHGASHNGPNVEKGCVIEDEGGA